MSSPWTAPAIIEIRASLGAVRTELVGLGASFANSRSVALTLGEHLILLDHDPAERCTTIAIGGGNPDDILGWLIEQLSDALRSRVREIPPPPTPMADAVPA